MVSTLESESVGPKFESRSNHLNLLNLFLGSPEFNSSTMLVNSQLVGLLPVGVLIMLSFIWIIPL